MVSETVDYILRVTSWKTDIAPFFDFFAPRSKAEASVENKVTLASFCVLAVVA